MHYFKENAAPVKMCADMEICRNMKFVRWEWRRLFKMMDL